MKGKRYNEEQIAFALRQAESGVPAVEVCRKMVVSELRLLRQFEEEICKLKKLVADLSLDKVMLQDVPSKKL